MRDSQVQAKRGELAASAPRSSSRWRGRSWFGGFAGALVTLVVEGSAGVLMQVDYTAGVGERPLVGTDGREVPDGNQVRIGTFEDGFDVYANAGDLEELQAHWLGFGGTEVKTLFGVFEGRFADTATSTDADFSGQRIYLWAFETRDGGPPSGGSGGFGNVEAHGLFSSTVTEWTFSVLGDSPPRNLRQISTSQVDIALAGRILDGPPGDPGVLQLVPEAEAAGVMIALGLLGFALARRVWPHGPRGWT